MRTLSAAALPFAMTLLACSSSSGNAFGPGAAGDDGGGVASEGGTGGGDDGGGGAISVDGGVLVGADGGAILGADGGPLKPGPGCTVTPGTSGTLLTGTLLLPGGPITGELLIASTGLITCAAASCSSTTGYAAATRLDCPSGVISPSLINTHDHTEYATTAPQQLGTTRYACRNEWRTGADGATALPDVKSTTDAPTIAAQELRFVMGGATSVVGSGGVGGLMRNLADYDNQSFVEGLLGKTVYFDTFPLGDSNGTVLTSGCGYPSIRKSSTAFEDGMYAPHISEGINPAAANEMTCTTQSSNDLVTNKTAVIHGVAVNATSVGAIATAGAKLVWAPRSNIDLYGDTAPVTVYEEEGVTIALGTDWLASGSMSMLRELACADSFNTRYLHGAFSDQQLWQMVTSNAAVATGFDNQIGTLATGMVADVALFDGSVRQGYRAVIGAGTEDVRLVLRGGKVLYGDADLVAALDTTCSAMTVCGAARSVCLDVPSVTLAQIQTVAQNVYPLFFCSGQAPTSEPSCTPYRESYANGITTGDQDGDGVPDATDDCPTVFNPVRPMDSGKQADVDGDGAGDACDAKPLDSSSH